MGPGAGFSNTGSNYNTFIGPLAGYSNALGEKNMFIGVSTGYDNTSGNFNLLLGYAAGRKNTVASSNSFLGYQSGFNTTIGSDNTFIGSNSGSVNVTGFNNTAIGSGADFGSNGLSNATAIGAGAIVSQNNSIALGNPTSSVGVGNSAPTARFHVSGGGTVATGVRLEGLVNASGTVYPLYVDGSGNVMKSSTAGAREAAESLDRNWMLTADSHLINNNAGGIVIGTGLNSTPTGYKLYVSEGILTERVKVAVKNTSEWRDNVLQADYNLRSIEEVEKFIKENKHLPGVPSAQEMVEKGNDLQKTDAVLLEKIEEIMLYVIDLKKENARLKSESEAQQNVIQSLSKKVLDLEKR
ncbi:hypothetical protein GCM10007390_11060 [Persicitalea jodogahamensis]|uniref:TMF family protein n=2 Tax=Persicitalea jodogahamensis TaxID=402147 RepID=A0A8J3D6G8_9BACT|nr:hypothetical protein GCM10007390_11060 [Persicitalea jodogahamensis]